MDRKIVEAVQRHILDPKGYAQLARNDIELVLNAYHAVMRENREELVLKIGHEMICRAPGVTGAEAAFDTLFKDKDNSNE